MNHLPTKKKYSIAKIWNSIPSTQTETMNAKHYKQNEFFHLMINPRTQKDTITIVPNSGEH